MPDATVVNSEALMYIAASLRLQADLLPAGAPNPLDISGSGDAGVISTAQSFSMWSALTGIVGRDSIDTVAQQVEAVVREYGDWDAHTAADIKRAI